jgi:hypothetical protein
MDGYFFPGIAAGAAAVAVGVVDIVVVGAVAAGAGVAASCFFWQPAKNVASVKTAMITMSFFIVFTPFPLWISSKARL